MCRGGPSCRWEAGHARRRTANIQRMFVTLEVSRLSGWLNADADCQVERERAKRATLRVWGGHEMTGRRKLRAREDPAADERQGMRGERTLNIPPMFLTLEVLMLSGWLNAAVFCQVNRGH